MKTGPFLPLLGALVLAGTSRCSAAPIWATGASLMEVIGYDLQAHDSGQKLTDYQTSAVCMLLGYFAGFVESSAVATHYDATALPFYLPDSVTNEEIEQVVYKYLSEHRDKLDLKGEALVVAALSRAFPNTSFKPPEGPAGN